MARDIESSEVSWFQGLKIHQLNLGLKCPFMCTLQYFCHPALVPSDNYVGGFALISHDRNTHVLIEGYFPWRRLSDIPYIYLERGMKLCTYTSIVARVNWLWSVWVQMMTSLPKCVRSHDIIWCHTHNKCLYGVWSGNQQVLVVLLLGDYCV